MEKKVIQGRCPREKLKRSSFMLKVLLFSLCLNHYALDSVAIQNQLITLKMQDVSLPEIFLQIEKTSDYSFIYNADEIAQLGKRSVDFKNESLENVLKVCLFDSPYTWLLEDNHVIINRIRQSEEKVIGKDIFGRVTDNKGNPLPGVTILIKGSTVGTATDIDGKWALTLAEPENTVLVFSFIGMKLQEIAVGSRTEINVKMIEESSDLDEVVVTGYQDIRKDRVTGSVTVITAKDIEKQCF